MCPKIYRFFLFAGILIMVGGAITYYFGYGVEKTSTPMISVESIKEVVDGNCGCELNEYYPMKPHPKSAKGVAGE